MWHVLHLIVRPFEALLGLFCVLTAIVLYPDEEGKIQSKFEDFWIRVDDFKSLALSRHAAFMTQVAKFETGLLDRSFGDKLISSRSIGVSFCLSIWSLFTIEILENFESILHAREFARYTLFLTYIEFTGLLVCALGVGVACIFLQRRTWSRRAVVAASFLFAACWMVAMHYFYYAGVDQIIKAIHLVLTVLGGFACDVAFIALTRRMIQWAGEMTSTLKVMTLVVLTMLMGVALVAPLFIVRLDEIGPIGLNETDRPLMPRIAGPDLLLDISRTNLVGTALSLGFILLSALFVIHRLFWPLLTRTLFRMQDIGTKGRRAILTAIGVAIMGSSVFGEKVPELLKDLIKTFGG